MNRVKIFGLCMVALVALVLMAAPPMGPILYSVYTTNTSAVIDARVQSLAGSATAGRFNTNQFQTNGGITTIKSGALITNTIADLRSGQKFSFKMPTTQYDFLRFGSSLMISNTADGNTLELLNNGMVFRDPSGIVLARLDTSAGTAYGGIWYGKFSGDGSALTNIPSIGQVYGGTTAERDAFTPGASYALWLLTDSVPPLQMSVWSGGVWN